MIFNQFDDSDIVSGRTNKVSSGFWPNGSLATSQSLFVDDFWSLTDPANTPSPAYGASVYDIRRTMYYINVFPDTTTKSNNDPYFTVTYGHIAGSGSFLTEATSILSTPTKAIYTQYKNLLLGTSDPDGEFSFQTGSAGGTVNADDIFVLSFSTYKMKDTVDAGLFQISFKGPRGTFTFIDDSSTQTQVKTVYNLISGSVDNGIANGAAYQGIGLLYPQNGVLVINASKLNALIGMDYANYNSDGKGPYNYSTTNFSTEYSQNAKAFVESLIAVTSGQMKVRKSEYVPSRQYFVRVKNRDFNYSNNPTYVYDGTDGVHPQGTIRNADFIDNPRTYPTTIGFYDDNNQLVAVAKFSRPAIKSFDNELLIKVRFDF